jgi:hypothetical protein
LTLLTPESKATDERSSHLRPILATPFLAAQSFLGGPYDGTDPRENNGLQFLTDERRGTIFGDNLARL